MISLTECAKFSEQLVKRLGADTINMGEVATHLKPVVETLDTDWTLNIPGIPDPSEAWLNTDAYQIGLFQEKSSVLVVVWVGTDMRSFSVSSAERLAALPDWVIPRLREQVIAAVQIAEAEKQAAALPPPELDKVMAALQRGARLQLGGGRWYETYFISDKKLRREIFDEGNYDEVDTTESELAESLKNYPAQALRQLTTSLPADG